MKILDIKSFKSIKAAKFDLAKLNVLTGLNNSGKSTVIQAIRMCCSAAKAQNPYIDGLGGYSDLKSSYAPLGASIDVALLDEENKGISLKLFADRKDISFNRVMPVVQYISADRFGPRVSLPLITDDFEALAVGSLGQYAAHYAQIFETTIVHSDLRHSDSSSNTLKHQLVRWMREISPGIELEFDVSKKYDASSLGVDGNRPTNSGFGISYTLPIVLCLLTMTGSLGSDEADYRLRPWFDTLQSVGGLLLLENPEAHLHPSGQTNMGRLIAMAAAAGLQIIVETHSDHLLDGIRLAVKEGVGPLGQDVTIRYFAKDKIEGTTVEDILLQQNGKLNRWPKGFFDQYSLNLRALAAKNG